MKSNLAFAALLVLLAAFCGSIVLRGRVIYPLDNRAELGISDPDPSGLASHRKFSDESSFYVPEIHHHLHGDRAGWISTWNPHVELGRPSSHVSGFSPAFVLTRALGWFTEDALALYTALTFVTLVLMGVFAFLFLRALELHPWACFAGSASLALGCFSAYWLTFVMFLGGLCWTLAILWLVVGFLRTPTFARGFGIAFGVHALLLTAYPQQIVWHAYLLAAFAITRWWKGGRRFFPMLALIGCVAAGFALAAPVYLDLALQASRSGRVGTDTAFFLRALPSMESSRDALAFAGQLFDAWWTGDPIGSDYGARFGGLCLTPLFAGLLFVSWMEGEWRRTALWLAFALIGLVLTLWRGAYVFGVEHLALNLSIFAPLAAASIPMAVACAYALDRVLREGFRRPWIAVAAASIAPMLALVSLIVEQDFSRPASIAFGLAVFAGFAALAITRKAYLVPVLVVATVVRYASSLVIARPESAIATTSPLVEKVRELTQDGSRFAIVGVGMPQLLPSNQEAWLGLRSVHSYDSLSSLAYQEWCSRVSTSGTFNHGRHFARIADGSRLGDAEMSWSGIGVLLSTTGPINAPGFDEAFVLDRLHVYRARREPELVAQLDAVGSDSASSPDALESATRNIELNGPLSARPHLPAEVVQRRDDELVVRTTASAGPTLLFVSSQFHPHWRASAGTTVSVNGFYEGVLVPPGTSEVRLEFRPFARWMWLPQIALAIGAILAFAFRRKGYPAGPAALE